MAKIFKFKMDNSECKIEDGQKQSSCLDSKSLLKPHYFHYIPNDERLISLLTQPPLISPFVISDKSFISPETSANEKLSFKIHQKILNYNRKQRSLEELSKKFLEKFEGKLHKHLQLHKVTQDLGVQRRRIYDIINILESLKVVIKKGKNNYRWKGLSEAIRTIKGIEENPDYIKIEKPSKEKSLQYLANSFLKLFLKKPAISLEQAAREILKEPGHEILRTKIRRLYDIVNVFKSLHLVKKVTLSNRKPGFKWLGIEKLMRYIDGKIEPQPHSTAKKQKQEEIKTSQKPDKKSTNSFFMDILEKRFSSHNVDGLSEYFSEQIFNSSPEKSIESTSVEKRKFKPPQGYRVAMPEAIYSKISLG